MDQLLIKYNIDFKFKKNKYQIYLGEAFDIFSNKKYQKYVSEDIFFDYILKYNSNEMITEFIDEYVNDVLVTETPEEIKDMYGWEEYYHISNRGYIISKRTGIVLKHSISNNGYYCVSIYKKDNLGEVHRVHRLVAQTFIIQPESDKKLVVDHINGNKKDNRVDNLRYCTDSENTSNAYRTGNLKPTGCKKVHKLDYDTGKIIATYNSAKEAMRKNNMKSSNHISGCCNGTCPSAGGFKWVWADPDSTEPELFDDEIFKKIPNMKLSNYKVSNYGKVKNIITKKMLKTTSTKKGYYRVSLSNDEKIPQCHYVQRLVALAFVRIQGIDYDTHVVNHKDENPSNNHYTNLEWLTSRANTEYSTGKKVLQLDKVTGSVIRKFNSIRDAARAMGKKYGSTDIRRCCLGKYPSAYGFEWKFQTEDIVEI
jgi:hypothetical protein